MKSLVVSKINKLLVVTLCLALTGCTSSTTRAPKYDNANDQANSAVVVIGTNDVSYFDIQRLGANVATRQKPQTQIAQNNTSKTNNPCAVKSNNNAKQQALQEPESADPNDLDYTSSSFNLRRLWDPKAPKVMHWNPNPPVNEPNNTKEIVPATTPDPTSFNEVPATVSEYRIHKQNRFFSPHSYSKAIYTIEPGTYYIAFAYYDHNSDVYFTHLPGITRDGVVQYGAFEIKPGDVLYLGDVGFDWVNIDKPNMVNLKNNFVTVQKDLIEHGHRELAVKIKMAKFYPAGTRLQK